MNLSYWEQKYYFEDNDLVVVGAGIVGLSTAIAVKSARPHLKVLVLERSFLPSGASTKNAGFACFGSVTELLSDSQDLSYDQQVELIKMRYDGLQLLQSNVSRADMSFRARGGIEILDENDEFQMSAIENIDVYNEMIADAIGLQNCFSVIDQSLSSFYKQAIYNQYEGELNPMHMMAALHRKALSLGVNLLYGIEVTAVSSEAIKLDDRIITSSNIAVCTNGLSKSLLSNLSLHAVRNQVYVTEKIVDNPLHSCYHYDQGYVYLREIDGRILIGGARNLYADQETTSDFGQTKNLREHLQSFVEEKIMNRKIHFEYEWSGILGVGETKAPIVEEIEDGLYVGVRLGGMGVAIGSGVGKSVAELILDK